MPSDMSHTRHTPLLLMLLALLAFNTPVQAQQVLDKTHYDNGQIKTLWFDMGDEHIQRLSFYPSGQLKEIGNWASGLMHGVWANWAENGTKLGEAEYHFGRRSGTWRLWDASGNPQYALTYRRDALVAYTDLK